MTRRGSRFDRTGFSLIELLVVIAIIAVLVSLLMAAVQRAREAANRVACSNNMHQLGIALHCFHDANSAFPCEDWRLGAAGSYYVMLLPFVEQDNQVGPVTTNPGSALPVKEYLCPSRRGVGVGARDDYASASQGSFIWSGNPYTLVTILGGKQAAYPPDTPLIYQPVTLENVTTGAGTSNTLLLSHKLIDPNYYNQSGGLFDNGWAQMSPTGDPYVNLDHQRHTEYAIRRDYVGANVAEFGSSHSSGMPCLFGDASVRAYPYNSGDNSSAVQTFVLLWAWNRTQNLSEP